MSAGRLQRGTLAGEVASGGAAVGPSPRLALVILGAATAAALALRWIGLRSQGLWLDEIGQAISAQLPLTDFPASVRGQAGAGPLDYVGTRLAIALFGDGTTAVRLWPFVVGTATVPLLYVATTRLTGSRLAGITAAFLLALSPFHIYYSQEARFYALTAAMAVVLVITYERAERSDGAGRWLVYGLTVGAAAYTHYYLVLVVAGLTGAGMLPRLDLRRLYRHGLALGVALILFLPWLLWAVSHQMGRRFHWTTPDWSIEAWMDRIGTLLALAPPTEYPAVAALPIVIALFLFGAVLAIVRGNWPLVALAAVAIATLPVIWLLAAISGYFLASRQAIFMLPLLYMLVAYGGTELIGVVKRKAAGTMAGRGARGTLALFPLAAIVAWAMLMAGPIQSVHSGDWLQKEDWPGATRFVESILCPDATVHTNVGAGYAYGIGYYSDRVRTRSRFVEHEARPFQDAIHDAAITRADVVVVLAFAGGAHSPNVLGLGALREHFQRNGWTERRFAGQLYVYYQDVC